MVFLYIGSTQLHAMPKNPAHNVTLKKAMLSALEASLGIVTDAAKIAGIDRRSHYRWLKDDPEYASAVEELKDVAIDFAESQLHQQIKNGNTTATIYFLKTQGRHRGYNERDEIHHTHSGDENNPVRVQVKLE